MSDSTNDEVVKPTSPLRVLEVEIATEDLGIALAGQAVPRARLVFQDMLPVESPARLSAVLGHGVVIEMLAPATFEYNRVLVPWSKISYVTTLPD